MSAHPDSPCGCGGLDKSGQPCAAAFRNVGADPCVCPSGLCGRPSPRIRRSPGVRPPVVGAGATRSPELERCTQVLRALVNNRAAQRCPGDCWARHMAGKAGGFIAREGWHKSCYITSNLRARIAAGTPKAPAMPRSESSTQIASSRWIVLDTRVVLQMRTQQLNA